MRRKLLLIDAAAVMLNRQIGNSEEDDQTHIASCKHISKESQELSQLRKTLKERSFYLR
jgi:hypothetical protein